MLRVLLAALGLLELLRPDDVIDFSTRLAYETPEEFEVKPWVPMAVRVEGLVFLLLAVRGFGKRGSTGEGEE